MLGAFMQSSGKKRPARKELWFQCRRGAAAFLGGVLYSRGAGGLGGCRSTMTESGCETMVMNQIELTTSDQNVFQ